jgi:hypothetical protein
MSQITRWRRNGGPRYLEQRWAVSPGTGEAHCLSEETMRVSQDLAVDGKMRVRRVPHRGTGEEGRHRGLAASNAALGQPAAGAVAVAARCAFPGRGSRELALSRLGRLLVSGRTSCSPSGNAGGHFSWSTASRCRESLVPRSVLDALFRRHPNLSHRKGCVGTKERTLYEVQRGVRSAAPRAEPRLEYRDARNPNGCGIAS